MVKSPNVKLPKNEHYLNASDVWYWIIKIQYISNHLKTKKNERDFAPRSQVVVLFAIFCYILLYFALAILCYTLLYFAILCYTLLYFCLLYFAILDWGNFDRKWFYLQYFTILCYVCMSIYFSVEDYVYLDLVILFVLTQKIYK